MNIGLDGIMSRLELALEAGGIAWWEIELPSGVMFFSENKAHMIGYESSKFVHYTDFTKLIHPDDYEPAMKAMRDHMEGATEVYKTAYRIRAKDGSYRMFFDRGKIVSRDDSASMKIAGVVVDVTEDLSELTELTARP